MSDFPGKMSSESEEQSLLARSESNTQEVAKHSRIAYTRDFMFSLEHLDAGKRLPGGIKPSILSELESHVSSQSCRASDCERWHGTLPRCLLQNSLSVGLLGNDAVLGAYGLISGASAPKFQDNSPPLLHRSKEPFRPRFLSKAENHSGKSPWDLCKDETFGSSECLSEKEEEEKARRDLFEVITEGHETAIQEKQKKNPNEHEENSKFVMFLEDSAYSQRNKCEEHVISPVSVENIKTKSLTNSLIPEWSDPTANYTKSPEICCSKFAHHFPATETKPTCGFSSCCEGSESMAHGVSKDLTREPSYCTGSRKRLQSTDASSFIQQPIVYNYVFPSTTNEYGLIGFDCEASMSSSSVDQSKSKENQLVSDDFIATFRSGVEIDPGLKLKLDSCFDGKDSLPIELLLPDEDSLITVDDFRCTPDKEDNTMLMVEGIPVKADRVSSISPVDTCRKLAGLNIFKNERSTQLSSEGSEQNACKSPAQFHQAQPKQGKTSFHPLDSQPIQAHMRSQMKPITSNYNCHKPSRHPSATNLVPASTFHHSHAKPYQQLQQPMLIPGILPHQIFGSPRRAMAPLPSNQSRYMQELGPIQDFPLNYQSSNHGCFGMPNPGTGFYPCR
ncbi:hypothetical protein PRUPE_2G301400 [Prunus persica]|uniref:Uncharacterized protein n=2 Tax=Prunus persica TaxID=3760 RepID=A0A251QNM2_PRUPE|nr:uncharacterized protein LOC109947612 isoform X1 [Prunus persica]ONI25407.1 hypothetical protein PRUPE_2G301400 [Prunus persica]